MKGLALNGARPFLLASFPTGCSMRRFRSLLAEAISLLVISTFCAAQQGDEANVIGEVRVERGGFPPHRIEVNLESRGALVNTAYTDDEGKFIFYNLKANLYHLSINAADYAPVQQSVEVMPFLNRLIVLQFTLVPKEEANSVAAAPARLGPNAHMMDNPAAGQPQQRNVAGNPYLTNPAEYTKRFPKDAIKEFNRGGESQRKGKLDDAVKHYQRCIALAPDFFPAHNDLGTTYIQEHDFSSARKEFDEVVKANPNDASAYFNLANVSLLSQQFQEGLDYVNRGLSKDPNSGKGLFIQGSLYRHLGRMAESERSLRNALQADPTLANAHLELVNLYRQEENRGAVVAELQAFLKLYPNHPMAPRVRGMLQKLGATAR